MSLETPSSSQESSVAGSVTNRLLGAGRESFWPLVDQGIVSIGNFATLVIVARALPVKSDYGVFGLVLEIIFYLNSLQSALITYPLTIKGAVMDSVSLRRLATAALLLTGIMVAPVALAGLGAAAFTEHAALGTSAAFAMITWQIQEVVRRALMARFRFAETAIGDGIRYLGTAGCLWIMWQLGTLTLPGVFVVIGLFSAVAIVIQTLQVGWEMVDARELGKYAREFYFAGRWMLFGTLSSVVISLCGVWAISLFHGNDPVGEFYAIANFTKPVNPLLATFGGLLMQHAARAFDSGGIHSAWRASMKFVWLICALTLPYLLLLLAVPGPAIRLLYGTNSHFDNPLGETALRLWVVGFIILVFMTLIGSFMNGIHRTRENFYAQVVNSIATVAIAFPLTIKFGLLGHIIGGIITALAQCVSMVWYLRKASNSDLPGACAKCGYDLRATPERCPECGTVPAVIPPAVK